MLRKVIAKELENAGVARIEIERSANKIEVTVYTAKPGIVIGKRGAKVEELTNGLQKKVTLLKALLKQQHLVFTVLLKKNLLQWDFIL